MVYSNFPADAVYAATQRALSVLSGEAGSAAELNLQRLGRIADLSRAAIAFDPKQDVAISSDDIALFRGQLHPSQG
jgi:hypothetical protein